MRCPRLRNAPETQANAQQNDRSGYNDKSALRTVPQAHRGHSQMANWMIQCPLNHIGVNVRRYRARSTPEGRRKRKPTAQRMPCATSIFWYGWRGISDDDDDEPEEPEEEELEVDAGFNAELAEEEEMALVKSRDEAPEVRCCWSCALTAELLGAAVPNAHMIFWFVSELACEPKREETIHRMYTTD